MTSAVPAGCLALVMMACSDSTPAPAPTEPVTTVSFNIAGEAINHPVSGPAIADQLSAMQPDFASVQECVCDALIEKLPANYQRVSGHADSEVGIVYAAQTWQELEQGIIELGNDDGWGMRVARWARMGLRGTDEEIYVYATHLCVPIRLLDDTCTTERQVAHARRIVDDIKARAATAVVAGDLNVFDGFEQGPVISYMKEAGLVDTLRAVTQDEVTTFEGNSWAPEGRIDYVLSTQPVTVLAAEVAAESASDHRPVSSTLVFD